MNPIPNFSFNAELAKFIDDVNRKMADYWHGNGFTHNSPSTCVVGSVGGRYAKLCVAEQKPPFTGKMTTTSVYCFVDLTNGDLLKAATWKAPAKNGVRGNLVDPLVANKFTQYGAAYLR